MAVEGTNCPVTRRLYEAHRAFGNEILEHCLITCPIALTFPNRGGMTRPDLSQLSSPCGPAKPLLHAPTMIRRPRLDTSTQFEESSPKPARGELQFQSHQEHVHPLPPFHMPKLDVKTKPRIPPQTSHLAHLTLNRTPVALLVKGTVDPLDDPRYLAAPIDILCESIKAPRLFSSHDLAEAYSTLSTKAGYGIDAIKDVPAADHIFAALEHIKTQAPIVCTAMQRDIRLAFVDPFLEVQPRNESSVASGSLPPSNTPAGTSFVERKLTTHEEKRGRGRSLVCIHALGFLSIVFRVGPFQRIFSCE